MNFFALAALTALTPLQESPLTLDTVEALGAIGTLRGDLHDTPVVDRPGDGRLWARGDTWKMSFGPEGSVYHPRLGPTAPGTPLGFRLQGARVGATQLALAAPAPATDAGNVVEIDHGPLVERWILAAESVEQTFVLEALPVRGELVVELELDTELEAVRDGGGWRFVGPDGYVRYGAATARDAGGREAAMEARLAGARLELVVPAAFVANAELPLVVDPVTTTGPIAGNGGDSTNTDITYIAALDQYLVTVSEDYTLHDGDVRAFIVTGSGAVQSLGSYEFDFTTEDWGAPRIGAIGLGSEACVVAVRHDSSPSVVVRSLNTGSGTLGITRVVYTAPTSTAIGQPDIAGDKTYSNELDNFVVVWNTYSSLGSSFVFSRPVSHDGQQFGARRTLAFGASPEVVRAASLSARSRIFLDQPLVGPLFVAAWERYQPGDTDIEFAYLESDSAIDLITASPITQGDARRPRVSNISDAPWPQARTYAAIAYESHGSDVDVAVAVIRPGHVARNMPLSAMEGIDQDHDQFAPTIGLHEDRIQVAYLQTDPAVPGDDPDVYMAAGGLAGGSTFGLRERRQFVGQNAWHDEPPAIAIEGESEGSFPFTGLIAWTRSSFVDGARTAMYSADIAGYQYCQPANNHTGVPGFIYVAGRPSAGGPVLSLRAVDLPVGQYGYFLVSSGAGYVPNVGGSSGHLCLSSQNFGRFSAQVSQVDGHGVLHADADPSALPQGVGTIAVVAGQSWNFQAWYRDLNHGGPTSNLTNAVQVTFH